MDGMVLRQNKGSRKDNLMNYFIIDNGSTTELARWLAKLGHTVYYFVEWRQGGFPHATDAIMGENIPGVIRVKSVDDYIKACLQAKEKGEKIPIDTWIFTDCYEADKQELLEHLGFSVYGSRNGAEIELDRLALKKLLKHVGLPVGNFGNPKTFDELIEYLKQNENQYVKISNYRGDTESFYAIDYKDREDYIASLRVNMAKSESMLTFISEDELPDRVETGIDIDICDGNYPEIVSAGIEEKDTGYLTVIKSYKDLPKEITIVTDKLAPYFKSVGYRGSFANEIRIGKDKKPYMMDATCRRGFPNTFTQIFAYKNLAEIYSEVAKGNPLSPETEFKYYCELVIKSDWAEKNPVYVNVPEKYRDNFFFKQFTIIDGDIYVIPHRIGMKEIGSVVAGGNTVEEAFENVEKIGKELKSSECSINYACIEKFKDTIREMKSIGINIFD
jgi:hypothetical protein